MRRSLADVIENAEQQGVPSPAKMIKALDLDGDQLVKALSNMAIKHARNVDGRDLTADLAVVFGWGTALGHYYALHQLDRELEPPETTT